MNCKQFTYRALTPCPVPVLRNRKPGTGAGSEPVPRREPAISLICSESGNRFPRCEKYESWEPYFLTKTDPIYYVDHQRPGVKDDARLLAFVLD